MSSSLGLVVSGSQGTILHHYFLNNIDLVDGLKFKNIGAQDVTYVNTHFLDLLGKTVLVQ